MYEIVPQQRSMRRATPFPFVDPLAALLAPLPHMDMRMPEMFDGFKTDIKETDNEYVLTADFPGAEKDEVDVKLEDDVLTVSYEHKQEEGEKDDDGKWVVHERSYSSMRRSFAMPDADEENTKASLENGVLTVTVPKKEKEESSKTIEIS